MPLPATADPTAQGAAPRGQSPPGTCSAPACVSPEAPVPQSSTPTPAGTPEPPVSVPGPTPAPGALLPADTGPSTECSEQPLIKRATAETAREEQRRDSPIGLLGASQEGPVRQDAQGARQEVPLPATPAAAALPAARECCGARGPCERGRAPSPCPPPPGRPDTVRRPSSPSQHRGVCGDRVGTVPPAQGARGGPAGTSSVPCREVSISWENVLTSCCALCVRV